MEQENRDDCPLTLAELGVALREAVDQTVREAIRAELAGPFKVDPEVHYQHHQMLSTCVRTREAWEADHAFIAELRQGAGAAKGAAIKSLIAALVTATLAGLVLLFRKV